MTLPVKLLLSSMRTITKSVVERQRLYLDYICWLDDTEQLSDFQVAVSPYTIDAPVMIDTGYPDAALKKLVMFVSGGAANTSYTISVIIRTTLGRVKRDDIGLKVTP